MQLLISAWGHQIPHILGIRSKPMNAQWIILHNDVIKWEHFPRYLPFVRGIHRSSVNSPHKGQWRGALMCLVFSIYKYFSVIICVCDCQNTTIIHVILWRLTVIISRIYSWFIYKIWYVTTWIASLTVKLHFGRYYWPTLNCYFTCHLALYIMV